MTTPDGYRHLTYFSRDWLSILFKQNKSFRHIGKEIGVHHTTVKREIFRNGEFINGAWEYDPVKAQMKYDSRKQQLQISKISKKTILESFIEMHLKKTWSPETISGYLKKYYPGLYVSHETIYKYIYNEKREWIELLAKGKRRRKRKNKNKNRVKSTIRNRVSKDERPLSVESRKEFGHYEADTIVSRQSKEAILVLIERKTRKIKLRKLDNKTAAEFKDKLVNAMKNYRASVKTITYDNGTENAYHDEINKKLNCKSYFCNPYHSWEKGSVENANGLIRRFIPKKTDLSTITKEELKRIENIINSRPRKILDFETPNAQFNKEWCTCR